MHALTHRDPASATAVPAAFADLAGYPGPVALMRGDGAVLAVNDGGSRWPEALFRSAMLRRPLAEAAATGAAVVARLAFPATAAADARSFEVTLVPTPQGTVLALGRETTAEIALRDALAESRRRYKDLVEVSSDFCWETDAEGLFCFVSSRGALGYAAHELIGRPAASFLLDETLAGERLPFGARAAVADVDMWLRTAAGAAACVVTAAVPVLDGDGGWRGARGVCRDVTEYRRRSEQLAVAETRERLVAYIVQRLHDHIDPAEVLPAAAEAVAGALGATCCRILRAGAGGELYVAATAGADAPDTPSPAPVSGGPTLRDGWLVVRTDYHGRVNGALALHRGDTAWSEEAGAIAAAVAGQLGIAVAQVENHEHLHFLSRTDELTGLLNRRAFFDDLHGRLARLQRGRAPGALFYIDLDNFKLVNDRHGHHVGDAALKAVARVLLDGTRPDDLVARLGGDEFAVWMSRIAPEPADKRAAHLLASAGPALAPYSGDPDRPLGMSIGVALYDAGTGETPADFITRADHAMYTLKHSRKGGFALAADAIPQQEPTP